MSSNGPDPAAQPGNPPYARYRRFDSFREYEELLDQLIPRAQRIIRVFDRTLSRQYNTTARIDSLQAFVRADPANRLHVILHDSSTVATQCPRFMDLLRSHYRNITVRQTLQRVRHAQDPFVTFDGSHYLHRFHVSHMRSAVGEDDVVGCQQLIDRFNELAEYSAAPMGTNVTGL